MVSGAQTWDDTGPVATLSPTEPRACSETIIIIIVLVIIGACHGDELVHQFKGNLPKMPFIPPSEKDQAFMNKFLKLWTNFAKTG